MTNFMSFDDAKAHLRPMAIGSQQLEVQKLRMRALGAPASAIPVPVVVAAEIGTVVVVQSPDGGFALGQAALDEWGVSITDVLAVAMTNVEGRSWELVPTEDGVLFAREFDLVAAALRRPEVLDLLELEGDPVVLMPSAHEMLVFGSTSTAQQVAAMKTAIDMLYATTTLCSVVPLVRRNGQWQVFEWPAEVRPAAANLMRHWKQAIYTTQYPILRDYMAAQKSSLAVGEIGIAKGADGSLFLMSIVNEATPVALPETEWVALTPLSSPPLTVSWADFVTIAGDRLKPVGVTPQRHYLTSFPTAQELAPYLPR